MIREEATWLKDRAHMGYLYQLSPGFKDKMCKRWDSSKPWGDPDNVDYTTLFWTWYCADEIANRDR